MTIKLASGSLTAGAALAMALASADPTHPLLPYVSAVYWRGGDRQIEDVVLEDAAVDRIVVWCDPQAVQSVLQRAPLVKAVVHPPRYAVSLIDAEALIADLEEAARALVRDAMAWGQKACNASLVAYLVADAALAKEFTEAVARELLLWSQPDRLTAAEISGLRRARRGALAVGEWFTNGPAGQPTSAAVYMPHGFDAATHPMTRLLVIRPIDSVGSFLELLHRGVSVVGVAPERLRLEVRDEIAARGVSAVLSLGETDTHFATSPHDSMRPLVEMVSWVVG